MTFSLKVAIYIPNEICQLLLINVQVTVCMIYNTMGLLGAI